MSHSVIPFTGLVLVFCRQKEVLSHLISRITSVVWRIVNTFSKKTVGPSFVVVRNRNLFNRSKLINGYCFQNGYSSKQFIKDFLDSITTPSSVVFTFVHTLKVFFTEMFYGTENSRINITIFTLRVSIVIIVDFENYMSRY